MTFMLPRALLKGDSYFGIVGSACLVIGWPISPPLYGEGDGVHSSHHSKIRITTALGRPGRDAFQPP